VRRCLDGGQVYPLIGREWRGGEGEGENGSGEGVEMEWRGWKRIGVESESKERSKE
jgi:hypothetical protein